MNTPKEKFVTTNIFCKPGSKAMDIPYAKFSNGDILPLPMVACEDIPGWCDAAKDGEAAADDYDEQVIRGRRPARGKAKGGRGKKRSGSTPKPATKSGKRGREETNTLWEGKLPDGTDLKVAWRKDRPPDDPWLVSVFQRVPGKEGDLEWAQLCQIKPTKVSAMKGTWTQEEINAVCIKVMTEVAIALNKGDIGIGDAYDYRNNVARSMGILAVTTAGNGSRSKTPEREATGAVVRKRAIRTKTPDPERRTIAWDPHVTVLRVPMANPADAGGNEVCQDVVPAEEEPTAEPNEDGIGDGMCMDVPDVTLFGDATWAN